MRTCSTIDLLSNLHIHHEVSLWAVSPCFFSFLSWNTYIEVYKKIHSQKRQGFKTTTVTPGGDTKYGAQIGISNSASKPQTDISVIGRKRFSFISFLILVGLVFRFGLNPDVDPAFSPLGGSSPALGPVNSWTGHNNGCSRLANRNRLIFPGAARLCWSAQSLLLSEMRSDSVFTIGCGKAEACSNLNSFVLPSSRVQLDDSIWSSWAWASIKSSVRNESGRSILHKDIEESIETSKQGDLKSKLVLPWNRGVL